MSPHQGLFENFREFDKYEKVNLGDGFSLEAIGVGEVVLHVKLNAQYQRAWLVDVLCVPKLAANLFSVAAAAKRGYVVQFGHSMCWVKDADKKLQATGSLEGKLYVLNTIQSKSKSIENESVMLTADTWHQRLGHVNEATMREMVQNDQVLGVKLDKTSVEFCNGCIKGKQTRNPFPSSEIKTEEKLELVHSDVCGKFNINSFGDACYFVTFIDDCTRMVTVYFIKQKSEVFDCFKRYRAAVETETGRTLKALRTDRGESTCPSSFKTISL